MSRRNSSSAPRHAPASQHPSRAGLNESAAARSRSAPTDLDGDAGRGDLSGLASLLARAVERRATLARAPVESPEVAASRTILLDGNVLDEINRGNAPVATKLRELQAGGHKLYISHQAMVEIIDNNPDPQMRTAYRAMVKDLKLELAPRELQGTMANRVESYTRNLKHNALQEQDVLVAAQAGAGGAEMWSYDRAYRNNPKGVQLSVKGIKIAPECTSILPTGGKWDYAEGRRLLGLKEMNIAADGTVVKPGGGPGAGGAGGTPPPATSPPATGGAAGGIRLTGAAATGPSGGRAPSGVRAYTGTPDMQPVVESGLNPVGVAGANAIVLALQGLNFVLGQKNASVQRERVQAALAALEGEIAEIRQRKPDCGVLVLVYFNQTQVSPDSPIQPGPEFARIELGVGRDPREADKQRRGTARMFAGLSPTQTQSVNQQLWIPALHPVDAAPPRPPVPVFGLGTFTSRRPTLQDVEWSNMGGFDDEGTTRLKIPDGVEPRFHVLQLPVELTGVIPRPRDPELATHAVPQTTRNGLPVVRLDPGMPFSDVVAVALFPADQETLELFERAPPTAQLGTLLVADFDLVRWARPNQVRLLQ